MASGLRADGRGQRNAPWDAQSLTSPIAPTAPLEHAQRGGSVELVCYSRPGRAGRGSAVGGRMLFRRM